MATAPVLGANGKLYYNTGSFGSPVWDLIPNCRDIETSLDFTDSDVTTRAGATMKQHEPALADLSFSISMLYDPNDADMAVLITAAWTRSAIEFLILDDLESIAGSQGIRGTFKI